MSFKDDMITMLERKVPLEDIVRRFYLVQPTFSFINKHHIEDNIMFIISEHFNIPISSIMICGSAKIGFSLYKDSDFKVGVSDLDVAIVNSKCYIDIFNKVLCETRNYSQRQLFSKENLENYRRSVSSGFINYKYLPNIPLKAELTSFFNDISIQYRKEYARVSCCFYLSEYCFKQKQINGLSQWRFNTLN